MRIFLIEWSTRVLTEVAKELQRKGVALLYWSGEFLRQLPKDDFPTAIFHHNLAAVKGLPAEGIDCSDFEPLSRETLEKLFECQCQTLTMMNRMDYSSVPFWRREEVYLKQVKYWQGVLRQFQPDAIVFSVAPHMVYDFVLYSLAKLLGIKTIMFDVVRLPERLLPFSQLEENGSKLKQVMFSNPQNIKVEDLPKDLQNYYLKIIDKQSTYYPFDIPGRRFQKKEKINYIPSLRGIFRAVKEGDFFKKTLIFLRGLFGVFFRKSCLTTFAQDFKGLRFWWEKRRWTKLKKGFKQEYLGLQTEVDLKKKYIFFPLQYQPERSTSPMAGVFCNQLLIVDILSKALPEDWLIYIKEHPTQFAEKGVHSQQGRFPGYYKELVKGKNVRLVPMEMPSNKLIFNSQAVATATGTAAWEAILKLKPAIVFGWPFYQFAEGVFRVSNIGECQRAIEAIKNGHQVNQQAVLNFLYALDKVCVRAHLGYRFEKDSEVSDEESVKNLTEAIYAELKN